MTGRQGGVEIHVKLLRFNVFTNDSWNISYYDTENTEILYDSRVKEALDKYTEKEDIQQHVIVVLGLNTTYIQS